MSAVCVGTLFAALLFHRESSYLCLVRYLNTFNHHGRSLQRCPSNSDQFGYVGSADASAGRCIVALRLILHSQFMPPSAVGADLRTFLRRLLRRFKRRRRDMPASNSSAAISLFVYAHALHCLLRRFLHLFDIPVAGLSRLQLILPNSQFLSVVIVAAWETLVEFDHTCSVFA